MSENQISPLSIAGYLITPQGASKFTMVNEPVEIGPEFEKRFQTDVKIRTKNVLNFKDLTEGHFGRADLIAAHGKFAVLAEVLALRFKTNFAMLDGVLVPRFHETSGIALELDWIVPSNMDLRMLTVSLGRNNELVSYLFATDIKNRLYRLPTSNVFEHCEICTGTNPIPNGTVMECMCQLYKSFIASSWNADLFDAGFISKAERMFGWKPDNDRFEQLPIDTGLFPSTSPEEPSWSGLCSKVANEDITQWIVTP